LFYYTDINIFNRQTEHLLSAELYTAEEKAIFVEAKKLGIHRTVHAGEGGPASNVIVVS
jgi:hypothetical protein